MRLMRSFDSSAGKSNAAVGAVIYTPPFLFFSLTPSPPRSILIRLMSLVSAAGR